MGIGSVIGGAAVRLSASAQALLEALRELGGEAGAGELAAATGIPPRTVTDALKALRGAELVESAKGGKGRVRLTASGRQHLLSVDPVSAGAVVDEALDLWAALGLYAHRAFLELLLSAIVGRHHIGSGKPDRHLAFIAVGEPGTGKSALAAVACAVLGLDLVDHELYVPAQAPGSVIGRRARVDGGGYGWEPAPVAGRPLVLFDEFDKADEAVRKALMPYLDGRVLVQFEGERVHLSPTPMLAANPPRSGDRLGHIRPEFRRRSVLLDTGYAAHRGVDVEHALVDYAPERERPHLNLEQLRLPAAVPAEARELLGSLSRVLTPAGQASKPPLAALEAATLGRAALAGDASDQGVVLAALSVSVAYLTVTEQLAGEVSPGWHLAAEAIREHLAGHGDVDKLGQVVAGARAARTRAQARVARARVAGEVEDLELTGAKHDLAEQLRLADEAIDGRKVPAAADKATAAALRAQLRKMKRQVLDCRSRGRLEDLRAVAAGPLEQARTLRRRIDREADERRQAERQAVEARRQDREAGRRLEQFTREQLRAQREAARAQLAEVRSRARELEQLWNGRRVPAGQPPWKVLEQRGMLRFEPMSALDRPDSWWRRVGTILVDGAGAGRWAMTAGDPLVAFSGTLTSCPELAKWNEGTRRVLLPWLAALHEQEDQLVAAHRLRPRQRPTLYRPHRPPAPTPLRVQSQRAPRRAALPPAAQRGR